MTELPASECKPGDAQLIIRPHRSLTRRQLLSVFALIASATMLMAGLSWTQGNALAPLFAVLELTVFAVCLRIVWRAGDRWQLVGVSSSEVVVRNLPDLHDQFKAHPSWVQLREINGRVMLASGRAEVEVGHCLGESERQSLAKRLRHMIAAAADGCRQAPFRAT